MQILLRRTVAAIAMTVSAGLAHAVPIYSNPSPFPVADLGTGDGSGTKQPLSGPLSLGGGETVSFTGASGVYSGNRIGLDKSPFGASARNYLAAEPTGTLTLSFATPQTSFSLLWGTIDSFNGLSFKAGTQTVSGADILTAFPSFVPGSSNEYITIADLTPFTSIAVTSTKSAFEFDTKVAAPEPLSLALLGAGLVGLGVARRRWGV